MTPKSASICWRKEGSPLILNDDQEMNDDKARTKTKCLNV